MKITNRLRQILDETGLYNYQPTDQLLTQELGGMTRRRFFQILNSQGKHELDVQELLLLEKWLVKVLGRSADQLQLLDPEVKRALHVLAQ